MLLTTAHRFIYGKRFILKMNRFNGFSSLFFITFKKELKIMETVKTVRNTYKSLPRPRSWAEVKSKNLILNFNLFWTGLVSGYFGNDDDN